MKGFVRYPGSKHFLASWILQFFPPHRTYVEVFGGSGALLFAKEPSPVEVYNDIDESLTTLFRVVRSPVLFDLFRRELEGVLYSRAEFLRAVSLLDRGRISPVRRAVAFFIFLNQRYCGRLGSRSWRLYPEDAKPTREWQGHLARLEAFHRRLKNVYIERADFEYIIDRWDSDETVFYLDPPYAPEARTPDIYDSREFGQPDHLRLVSRLLKGIRGTAFISGYDSDLYRPLEEAGWARFERRTRQRIHTRSTDKDPARVEVLWAGPPERLRSCSTGLLATAR